MSKRSKRLTSLLLVMVLVLGSTLVVHAKTARFTHLGVYGKLQCFFCPVSGYIYDYYIASISLGRCNYDIRIWKKWHYLFIKK